MTLTTVPRHSHTLRLPYSSSMELLRALHISSYVVTGLSAATLTLVFPIVTLEGTPQVGLTTFIWAILLMSTTSLCVIGLLMKTWVGEYIGLLGVIVSYLVFALAGMSTAVNMFATARVLIGSIIFALSTFYGGVIVLCVMRFREVASIRKRQLKRGGGR